MVGVNEGTNALQGRMSEQGLNMVTSSYPCDGDIRFILNIVTLSHPCDRNIPFLLNIKKPNMDIWLDTVNLT